MKRILVNDRYLLRQATGVSMYLLNVLRNWPEDAVVGPVGFWKKDFRAIADRQRRSSAGPLRLVPLSACLGRGVPSRRPSPLVRRIASGAYAAAFRAKYRMKGCSAQPADPLRRPDNHHLPRPVGPGASRVASAGSGRTVAGGFPPERGADVPLDRGFAVHRSQNDRASRYQPE